MQMKLDPEVDDYLVSQGVMGKFIGVTSRQVRNLVADGTLIEEQNKKLKLIENIQRYFKKKHQPDNFEGDSKTDLERLKLEQEVRKLKHTNDINAGIVAPVDQVEALIRPVMARLSQAIDRLPDIAGDACKEVDGRGREKMAAALVTEKNELARIPERYLAGIAPDAD